MPVEWRMAEAALSASTVDDDTWVLFHPVGLGVFLWVLRIIRTCHVRMSLSKGYNFTLNTYAVSG